MDSFFNSLGNAATGFCVLACACLAGIVVLALLLLRFAGASLIPMVSELVVGRITRTPEEKTTPIAAAVASSAVLKTQAQSLDFDEAVRRQAGGALPMQAQAAAYPPQAQPPYPQQNFANPGYTAQPAAPYRPSLQPSLQSIPPSLPAQLPTTGTVQPLYDNRVQPGQPMQAQSVPTQPYPSQPGYPPQPQPYPTQYGATPPMGMPATPSLGQPSPTYQPLGGGYQQGGQPPMAQNADPNSFFPPPSSAIPRRATLSAPRDVSAVTGDPADMGFNSDNYPGLRSRGRRRADGQPMVDDQDAENRPGLDNFIGGIGNFLGL